MTASRIHRYGPPGVIDLDVVERPHPAEGEVLVRVKAAGVSLLDAWIRAGRISPSAPLPLTLGSELAGVVAAVGPGVANFTPGDAVFGVSNPGFTGACAEYAVASTAMIAKQPGRLDFIDAASIPVVAVSAWQALFDHADLAAGQSVLIRGAASNIGAFAVQLAARAGLRVIATADDGDTAYVRGLGASVVINARSPRFEEAARDVDAVVDLVGGGAGRRSFSLLKRGGVLVSTVSAPDQEEAARYGVRALFFVAEVTTARLARIAAMIDAGELSTHIGAVLALAGVRVAHEMMEGARPHPRGKIVLRIGT
ncbi:NADP-dependent oxidoreductase [Ancylobacter oerskovii]|nr:NADP-dependent oxidoreductase [Ancylobacter oerskovii]MBS7542490.1 NADP-dependent oxidoreductase [Ancylobacter oerskovii]